MIVDRYALHGLQRNPFAVRDADSEAATFFVDRQLPEPPAERSCTLVQVIGQKGAGKSTQLLEWQRRTPGPYHYVPAVPYRSRWSVPPVAPLVYADEIDRMPKPLRSRWFRKLASVNATLIAATHRDLERPARRAGLAVATHHLGPVELATVHAVVTGKVRRARLASPRPAFALTESEIATIHRRSRGSLRTAELVAHAIVARRVHDQLVAQASDFDEEPNDLMEAPSA